jgi:hypothetical protein
MSMTLEQSLKEAKCLCQWGHNPDWMGCDKAVADRAAQIHGAAKNYYDANFSYEAIRRKSKAATQSPSVGDRFHEMYSYWEYVVHLTDKHVFVLCFSPPCEVPTDGKLKKYTRERFAKSELDLADNKNVEGWYEGAIGKVAEDLIPVVE